MGMLLKASIENFMSIADRQTIDFTITKKDKLNDASTNICGKYFNNIACIMGANGSGKSNVLKALNFFISFIQISYFSSLANDKIPVVFHKALNKKNTIFELEFIKNLKHYKYKIKLNRDLVEYEYLGIHIERGFTKIYEIDRIKNIFDFNSNVNINENDKIKIKEKQNSSAFSYLTNNFCLTHFDLTKIVDGFYNRNLDPLNITQILELFKINNNILINNEKLRKDILKFLNDFGFDIENLEIEKSNGNDTLYYKHKKGLILPLIEESLGTQNSITLLANILIVLKKGGFVIVDEIENGIHPFIIEKLISLFADKTINKNNAQIIFSTHQPYLLSELTKTQIFFTEKEDLQTEIYRLDDVEGVRNDDNFYTKYLNGVYGGVPEVR